MIWSVSLTEGNTNCESVSVWFDKTVQTIKCTDRHSAARAPLIRAMTQIERQDCCRFAEHRWLHACRWPTVCLLLSKQMTSSVWHTAPENGYPARRLRAMSTQATVASLDCCTSNPLITCPKKLRPFSRISEAIGKRETKPLGLLRLMANVGRLGNALKQKSLENGYDMRWEAEKVKRTEKATVKSKLHNSDNFRLIVVIRVKMCHKNKTSGWNK